METIISYPNDGLLWPWDIDIAGNKLYWIDGGEDVLYKANLDGSQTDSVMAGVGGEYFVIDSSLSYLYLSERGKITRVNMDGSGRAELVSGLGYFLMGIDLAYHVPPTAISGAPQAASDFRLYQNYPNPFGEGSLFRGNPQTMIHYELAKSSYVDLSIYNTLGQKVATLVSKNKPSGTHRVQWDASGLNSGVYFIRMQTNAGFSRVRKCMLIK